MANRRRLNVEEGKDVCTKEWGIKSGDNSVVPWCTDNKAWKKIENHRMSNEKLLMAGDNKKYEKIYRRLWSMSKNEE